MNKVAIQAYGTSTRMGLAGRMLEAEAFTSAANKLQEARDNPEDQSLRMEALRFNNRLWTIVQVALGDSQSGLSDELSAQLASLSIFVDGRNYDSITDSDPALLDALIEINSNLAMAQFS